MTTLLEKRWSSGLDAYLGVLDPSTDSLPKANIGHYFIAANSGDIDGLTVVKDQAYRCNVDATSASTSSSWERSQQHDYISARIPILDIGTVDTGRWEILGETSAPLASTITRTSPIIIQGDGSFAPNNTGEGTVVDNTGADIRAFHFDGTGPLRMDRVSMSDMTIQHGVAGSTQYAIHHQDSRFPYGSNIYINCDDVGFGGLMLGDPEETDQPADDQAYFAHYDRLSIRLATGIGVRFNTPGTQALFNNCHVGCGYNDNAIAGLFEKEGVTVRKGQWGSHSPNGGIGLSDYNRDAGERPGNVFDSLIFERSENICISFDGLTRGVIGGRAEKIEANFASVLGTLIYFGRAEACVAYQPQITNPTQVGGGTLVEWSANSKDCVLECNYDAAIAPIVVDPAANKPLKKVTGRIAAGQVSNITTAPNLTTMLVDGIAELPDGFIPVHNGVAWNYVYTSATDDSFFSFTPPSDKGKLTLITDQRAARMGTAFFDVENEQTYAYGGDQFGVGTVRPTGTTNANNFTTIFSDSTDGQVYVEVRGGSQLISILIESF